jgi:hypothetical protein
MKRTIFPKDKYYKTESMRLERKQGALAYPPKSIIAFYDCDSIRNRHDHLIFWTRDRLIDLSDHFGSSGRARICVGITTESRRWGRWTEENIKRVETRFRYDLKFDGFSVRVRRLSTKRNHACAEEFLWRLIISGPDINEIDESADSVDEGIDQSRAEIASLRLRLWVAEKAVERLESFESYADRALEELLSRIQLGIVDFRSAHEAVNFYDTIWFKRTPISRDGKIRVAAALANAVSAYRLPPASIWKKIIDHDTDFLEEIDFDDDLLPRDILK